MGEMRSSDDGRHGCSQNDLTNRFESAGIDWIVHENHLLVWALFCLGKRLKGTGVMPLACIRNCYLMPNVIWSLELWAGMHHVIRIPSERAEMTPTPTKQSHE